VSSAIISSSVMPTCTVASAGVVSGPGMALSAASLDDRPTMHASVVRMRPTRRPRMRRAANAMPSTSDRNVTGTPTVYSTKSPIRLPPSRFARRIERSA
jgi:hypothetical protein